MDLLNADSSFVSIRKCFFANLDINLYVCLCGDQQVISAQPPDFLDIRKSSSFPDWKRGCTRKPFPDEISFKTGIQ